MRKIVAFILCALLTFGFGLSITPTSFNLIISWLGPVFGTSLHVFLSMVFILLGNPLKFTSLIFLWVSVGFICGLIVRRWRGSLSSAWLIFSFVFLVIFIAFLRMIEIAINLPIFAEPEKILTILPPLPLGISLGMVLEAPIINDIYSVVRGLSFTSQSSPTAVIFPILDSIGSNFVEHIILLFASSLVGCEVGKLIEKHVFRKKAMKSSESLGSSPTANSNVAKKVRKIMMRFASHVTPVSFLVSILLVSTVLASPLLQIGVSGSYYAEGMFAFTTPDGTAYLASAFVDSMASLGTIDLSSSEFSGALMGVLISHDTSAARLPPILSSPQALKSLLPEGVPNEMLVDLTKYYELVPKTIYLMAYVDVDANAARQRADIVVSKFSSTFSAPLDFLIASTQETEIGNSKHSITLLAYQSTAALSTVGSKIMGILPIQRKGLISAIDYAYRHGVLTPGATGISANGTVMAVGFFSSSTISNMISSSGSPPIGGGILPNMTAPTPIFGVFSYWINRFHSSDFVQEFSINDLLGYSSPIQFSPDANVGAVAIVALNATIEGGKIVSQKPIVSIVTSANLTQPELASVFRAIGSLNEIPAVKLTQAPAGSYITNQAVSLGFIQVFPLSLRVEKVVSLTDVDVGQRVDVSIRIVNNDTDAARNITLDDSMLFDYYGPSAIELVSGSLTHTWSTIPAKSTMANNYTILLKREGIYTLPSAEITYNYVDQNFSAESNYVYLNVKSPSALSLIVTGIPSAWGVLERIINKIPGIQGNGSLILTAGALVIIVPLVAFEYRNFRKWQKTRKET
jgi:hypothetical protein